MTSLYIYTISNIEKYITFLTKLSLENKSTLSGYSASFLIHFLHRSSEPDVSAAGTL